MSSLGASFRTLVGGRELWALADQALVSAANFLTNVMLARALGLSGFGVFALCWMVVLQMAGLQLALVTVPMMSIGPKQETSVRAAYFGSVSAQAFCLASICGLITFLGAHAAASWFPSWRVGPLALPLATATSAYMLQDFLRRYFFTIHRSRLAMACDALSYLTQLPLLWILARRGELTSTRALWIIGVTSVFSVLVSFFWREKLELSLPMTRVVAVRHWKMARWLAPSTLLQQASVNLFLAFAPVYYGAEAVGALRACQNIVAIAHIWFLGLDNVMPAEAALQFHQYGAEASLSYVKKMLVRWGLVTIAFMALISLAPAFWLSLLYGTHYAAFGYILRLYGILYLMVFIGGPLRAGLQAIEFTAPLLWSYLGMTLVAAGIAAPMAKHLGLLGVMLGLIATQGLFQFLLAGALVVRTGRIRKQKADWMQVASER